ncbi:SMI1/KNR4 family protein [Flavobacterium reichenbachii]|uniref:Glucan biosynthesis protein n=1 Tax=Flavobacterium reichenbachii TaxID=362418 RepID=A0A085ZN11_9FLAO|nr:SMI1/KNR4 family protein [Flavobacterium reichenbachii]KFF05825.1 glucan biosynthesis protein [Flavobacterium reichenbachii]OXB12711.1 SMI1/KNR4 family protein [Flavobacterium reichenbachii]
MIDQKTLNQIERIKTKLILAKEIDNDFEVFAADRHKYLIGETISSEEILKFERSYTISLPESYKAFLQYIGNGGISNQNAAAGPGYGIFLFGKNIAEFVYSNPENFLKQDCKVYPEMSDNFWKELNMKIDEDISDEDFEYELGKIFSGILPIGTEGCTYYYGLVLNGEFKGRVVNIDIDRRKPYFAFESDFLDWYERWLDEITAEKINDNNDLFNHTLGGVVTHILDVYNAADVEETKLECLIAILKKKEIASQALDVLEKKYKSSEGVIQHKLLQVLTKFDYNRAYPYLIDFAKNDILSVFQFVFWYAKDKSLDWLEFIKENIQRINDEKTFQFCTYLLKEMKLDYGIMIIPFSLNENKEIRRQFYYSLGQLENKRDYLDTFIIGLNDNSNWVVHAALQALNGIKDEKLLVHYKAVAEKFSKEQDYILPNLSRNLEFFGLTLAEIKL